jgi:glycosyltransferase involved in cell wall biosynthesis
MRVGFDTSPLVRPHPPGIVRVVEETLRALEARAVLDVVRLAPDAGDDLRRWRRRVLPAAAEAAGLAGVHSFLSAFPLRGAGKRVQTVHELPWRHGVAENAGWRHRAWVALGRWRADAIVTATETTARELGARRCADGGKLAVIPWGVGAPFGVEPAPGTIDEPLLERYRLPGAPLVLCLGAVRAKKNLAAVLRGVARLAARPSVEEGVAAVLPHVVVTGPETAALRRDLGLVAQLGIGRHVSTLGAVEAADLPGLLRLAAVVPVLSRSEGFGLPVLEALASGTPVLVPRGSAQAEVAGELAFVCDADDPASVADGLAAAIEQREELRYALPARAAEFPWERTARGVEELWSRWA